MKSDQAAYDELCCYTIAHSDASFIHQHVVDAFAAQTADEHTKPITLTFALVGLYLHIEKQFSGKQVQQALNRCVVWLCLESVSREPSDDRRPAVEGNVILRN